MTRKIAPILHEIIAAIDGIQMAVAGKTFADFQKDYYIEIKIGATKPKKTGNVTVKDARRKAA
jgi:hypothetical protein